MADEWQPTTEVAEDEWQPTTERTVVKEHTRKRRGALETQVALDVMGARFGLPMGAGTGIAQRAIGALPTLGGIAGAALGGAAGATTAPVTGPAGPYLGAVGGSAALGGAGQAAQNVLGPYIGLPEEEIGKGVAGEAIGQGVGTALGVPIAKMVGKIGGALTGRALAREAALSEKLARESPVKFQTKDIFQNMGKVVADVGHVSNKGMIAIRKKVTNFLDANPGEITAARLHRIAEIANGKFKNAQTKALDLEARYWDSIRITARQMLRDAISGYEAQQSRVAAEIGLRRLVPPVQEGPIAPKLSNLMGATEVAGRQLFGEPARQFAGNILSHPLLQLILQSTPGALGSAALPE